MHLVRRQHVAELEGLRRLRVRGRGAEGARRADAADDLRNCGGRTLRTWFIPILLWNCQKPSSFGNHTVSGGTNTMRITQLIIHTTNGNTAVEIVSSVTFAMLEVMNRMIAHRRRHEADHAGDDEDEAELDVGDAVLLGDRRKERRERRP